MFFVRFICFMKKPVEYLRSLRLPLISPWNLAAQSGFGGHFCLRYVHLLRLGRLVLVRHLKRDLLALGEDPQELEQAFLDE